MNEKEKWDSLQRLAVERAKKELLDALLLAIGLDEYIAEKIKSHESQMHDSPT